MELAINHTLKNAYIHSHIHTYTCTYTHIRTYIHTYSTRKFERNGINQQSNYVIAQRDLGMLSVLP